MLFKSKGKSISIIYSYKKKTILDNRYQKQQSKDSRLVIDAEMQKQNFILFLITMHYNFCCIHH